MGADSPVLPILYIQALPQLANDGTDSTFACFDHHPVRPDSIVIVQAVDSTSASVAQLADSKSAALCQQLSRQFIRIHVEPRCQRIRSGSIRLEDSEETLLYHFHVLTRYDSLLLANLPRRALSGRRCVRSHHRNVRRIPYVYVVQLHPYALRNVPSDAKSAKNLILIRTIIYKYVRVCRKWHTLFLCHFNKKH